MFFPSFESWSFKWLLFSCKCFFLVNGEEDRQPTMKDHTQQCNMFIHHDKSFYLMRTKYKFFFEAWWDVNVVVWKFQKLYSIIPAKLRRRF